MRNCDCLGMSALHFSHRGLSASVLLQRHAAHLQYDDRENAFTSQAEPDLTPSRTYPLHIVRRVGEVVVLCPHSLTAARKQLGNAFRDSAVSVSCWLPPVDAPRPAAALRRSALRGLQPRRERGSLNSLGGPVADCLASHERRRTGTMSAAGKQDAAAALLRKRLRLPGSSSVRVLLACAGSVWHTCARGRQMGALLVLAMVGVSEASRNGLGRVPLQGWSTWCTSASCYQGARVMLGGAAARHACTNMPPRQ